MSIGSFSRKASKAAVLPAGLWTRRRPGDLVVLLYHRVGVGNREIDVPAGLFDEQMSALTGGDRVVSLPSALADGDPRGGVAVTFDDGYRDFVDHALPVLVRHRIPAVLYLATGLVAEPGKANGEALSWSQLRDAVATDLVTVGSHTHDHADLSKADEATAGEQMRRSKELIEDRLGVACRHFAYPWAVGSPVADRVARRVFDSAALGAWKTNRRGRTDPFRLGRTPVLRSDGTTLFRAKARGLLDGEALLYRALRRGPWRKP